jgi:hypothetical protein
MTLELSNGEKFTNVTRISRTFSARENTFRIDVGVKNESSLEEVVNNVVSGGVDPIVVTYNDGSSETHTGYALNQISDSFGEVEKELTVSLIKAL